MQMTKTIVWVRRLKGALEFYWLKIERVIIIAVIAYANLWVPAVLSRVYSQPFVQQKVHLNNKCPNASV